MRELSTMKPEALLEKGISDDDAHWLVEYAGRVYPIYEKAGVKSLHELASMKPDALMSKGFSEVEANSMVDTARRLYPQ